MAGLFGIGDFTKEGAGVSKNVAQKKRFFVFWELVWRKKTKLIGLNLLYLVCCLPIVTIGPATAGLMRVLRDMSNEDPGFVVSDFFDTVKKNWKQAFVVWLIHTTLLGVAGYGIWFYYSWATQREDMKAFGMIALVVAFTFGFAVLFAGYYAYLLLVTCDLKLKPLIKNSAILGLVGFKSNIITTFMLILTFAFILFPILFISVSLYPITILLFLLFGAAFPGLIIAFNSYKYITKYVTDPYYEEHADEREPEKEEALFDDELSVRK